MHRYPITIHGIFIAPKHKVFGRGEEQLSGDDLESLSHANLIADAGIEGDRFCRLRPDYNGHVTFFSLEAWDAVVRELNLPLSMGPERTRRNVMISGVDLKALYGSAFLIQDIQFFGTGHCAPCPAMNRAIGPGATEVLRSRGGLRAQVKSNGTLRTGISELRTRVSLDPSQAAMKVPQLKLP